MATNTTKLALSKPDGTDLVDIAVLNGNFDKIDAASGATICTSSTRPASPFNGQLIFETDTLNALVYRTSTTSWNIVGGSTVSSNPPAGAGNGNFWWDSDNGILYIYYNDGNSSQWVSVMPSQTTVDVSQNYIVNGGMDIWQRGTSFSLGIQAPYTADRWQAIRGGGVAGMTVSRQTAGLDGFQYSLRAQRDSGNTGTADLQVCYSMETVDSIPLAGKTVTLSFYARAGANYSSTGGALNVSLKRGTSTDANVRIGQFSGTATDIVTSNITLGSSWNRYSVTGTVPAGTTQIGMIFSSTSVGTAGANDWYEITGVQLERGVLATSFRRNGENIEAELAACQRYYYRFTQQTHVRVMGLATNWSGGEAVFTMATPVNMRIEPSSVSMSNVSSCLFLGNNTNYTGASLTSAYGTTNTISLVFALTQPVNLTTHVRPISGTIIEATAEL